MSSHILARLLAHNNWANLQILDACQALSDEQLDFKPNASVHGTIRETLHHFVLSQEDYVSMLTTLEHPPERENAATFAELRKLIVESNKTLISFLQNSSSQLSQSKLALKDGYKVAPWLFFVQLINHATEHREQIKSIMTELSVEPPRIDGWIYGRQENGLISPEA